MTLADRFDAFLFDLDGVVWRGEELIPGASRTIALLREQEKRVVFVTNNASRSSRQYAVKLMRMRIPTEPSDIVTSGHVVLAHLHRIGLRRGDRIHVCAAPAVGQLLRGEGFVPTNQTRGVKALVVAWNPKLTFDDIRHAADVARTGVPFIAANTDATYPSEHGLLPGSGSIVAAIEVASGQHATSVGKPRPELFRLALERAGSDPLRTLVCGDRSDTDVAGARAAGVPVALVLTGVTLEQDLASLAERPDWILRDITELLSDQTAEPASLSAGPVVHSRLGTPVAAEHEDEDDPGYESADMREIGDTST